MGVVTVGELKQSASAKIRTFRPSLSSRHHADWLLSDVSSDITVEVGTTCFSLHKVHPNIKESDRYRLCKTIDSQKLSQEACSHAAQNERLPVQMAVQVLYFEQLRLRNAMNNRGGGGGHDQFFQLSSATQYRPGSGVGSGAASPRDNYALVRRENRELKLEVARMRMRLTDLEKDHVSMKQELVRSSPGGGATGLLRSFTRKLGKLNDLFRLQYNWDPHKKSSVSGAVNPPRNSAEARLLFQIRRRRHSVS